MIHTKQILLSFLLLFFIASCTDDDDGGSTDDDSTAQDNPLSGDFFPSNADNEWNYDVTNTNNETDDSLNSTDRLYLDTPGDPFILKANTGVSNGTMTGILTNGTLSKTDITLNATGQLAISVDGLEDINIPYTDAILYNLNAADGSELSSFTGTITQTIQSFPVTINYTLKTAQVKNWSGIDINGQAYSDVTQSTFILNMKIDITLPIVGEKPVVDEQDALIITNYFGKNIGLIQTEANTKITPNSETIMLLESIPDINTNQIPSSISITNIQNLTDYTVN